MKEKSIMILICAVLLVIGGFLSYYSVFHSDFNFYKAELKIDGNKINEKLYFEPDKGYHTLFRNFETDIQLGNVNYGDSVIMKNVECSAGNAYARSGAYCNLYGIDDNECPAYTENNEYGCSFGMNIGFYEGNMYNINADYELNAETIFEVNGKDYIKFVAYSPNRHVYLKKNKNLFIEGEHISKDNYFPNRYSIIYIPYDGSLEGKKIVYLKNFEFDREFPYLSFIFMTFIPALLFFVVWFIFGREKRFIDVPESLSYYPKERKAWEVSAFFAPPFNKIDDKFFASIMLDFYHRKIIDVKTKEGFFNKKTLIKINRYDETKLDDVEKEFLKILEYVRDKAKENRKEGEYLDIAGAVKSSFMLKYDVSKKFKSFNKKIEKIGEEYVSVAGNVAAYFLFFLLIFAYVSFVNIGQITTIFYIFAIFIFVLGMGWLNKSALFTKHKKDFYQEYQGWQAFKNYLKAASSIKKGDYKAVKLWDKYMVYALALGISKKALKQLKEEGLINDNEYNASIGFVGFSHSFSASTGTGSSGGMGGAGGGGVGGGGGGGR